MSFRINKYSQERTQNQPENTNFLETLINLK